MLAVSIFFYATSFIYQKKLFKYVCLILLAALFHKSAILLIPVYIVGIILPPKFRINTRTFVIILLTLSAVIVTGQYMFTFLLNLSLLEKYSKYQYYSESATGLVLFTKLLILGSVTLMFNRMRSYSNFAFIYIMSITEVMILILARGSIDLSRFSLYFSIFPIILLANLIRVFERSSRYIVVAGLITYALAIFIISFYIKGGAEIFPYKALLIRSTP
jgi:transmembrane protein EpsG